MSERARERERYNRIKIICIYIIFTVQRVCDAMRCEFVLLFPNLYIFCSRISISSAIDSLYNVHEHLSTGDSCTTRIANTLHIPMNKRMHTRSFTRSITMLCILYHFLLRKLYRLYTHSFLVLIFHHFVSLVLLSTYLIFGFDVCVCVCESERFSFSFGCGKGLVIECVYE